MLFGHSPPRPLSLHPQPQICFSRWFPPNTKVVFQGGASQPHTCLTKIAPPPKIYFFLIGDQGPWEQGPGPGTGTATL